MEEKQEKKQLKVSLKTAILLIIIFIMVIAGIVLLMFNLTRKNHSLIPLNQNGYKQVLINGNIYYERIGTKKWNGEYQQEKFGSKNDIESTIKVVSYKQYLDIIKKINSIDSYNIKAKYHNLNCNYIIMNYAVAHSTCNIEIIDCFIENNKIIIYGQETSRRNITSWSWIFYSYSNKYASRNRS